MDNGEIWLPIPGHEEYLVSSTGRVLSKRFGRPMYQVKNDKGYWTVKLRVEGRQKTQPVHRLVCNAFHGPPPCPNAHVAHNNGRPSDNRRENLRWTDAMGNAADRLVHGTQRRGDAHGRSKLTTADVLTIRERLALGETRRQLAREYGVCVHSIRGIAVGRTWGHLDCQSAA